MRHVRLYTGHHRDGRVTYHYEIDEVPVWRHVLYEAYHWYDMRVPLRVPGWNRVERMLRKYGAEIRVLQIPGDEQKERWRDRPLGWTIRQDLRCFELGRAKRKTLIRSEVTEQEYLKMGGTIRKTIRPQTP